MVGSSIAKLLQENMIAKTFELHEAPNTKPERNI
jgi:hypothetical protein